MGELRAAMRARGYTDSVYFEFQVDQPVRLLPGAAQPTYPPALRAASTQGDVLAQFVIDTAGYVIPGSLNVLRSSHEEFTNAVRAAVYSMRFSPARHGGRKVIQAVQQPFEFRLAR
jgi:TonB family protein